MHKWKELVVTAHKELELPLAAPELISWLVNRFFLISDDIFRDNL